MIAYEPDKPLVLIDQPPGNSSFFRDMMLQLFGKKFLDLSERLGTPTTPWATRFIRCRRCRSQIARQRFGSICGSGSNATLHCRARSTVSQEILLTTYRQVWLD